MPKGDKNRGAEFAQMEPERRKRFEETSKVGMSEVEELDFPADDPRDADKMGRHNQPRSTERAIEKENEVKESGEGE